MLKKIAVISFISFSKSESYQAKNAVIYALGYARDARALPALRAVQSGTVCDLRFINQENLKRTIGYLEGIPPPFPNFK
jgi:hypothetical protein